MSQLKSYVEFYFPGVVVRENSVEEVASRKVKSVKVPADAFAFKFFDIKTTKEDGVTKCNRFNVSPRHYYGGRIMTLEEVKAEMPGERTLIATMIDNGLNRIIVCRTGNIQFIEDDDVFIKAK